MTMTSTRQPRHMPVFNDCLGADSGDSGLPNRLNLHF